MTITAAGGSIPTPEEFGEHIARLNAESVEAKRRLEKLEEHYNQLRNDVQQLTNGQTETKTLITALTSRFGEFEGRVFNVFAQMAQDNAKLLQSITKGGQQERTQQLSKTNELIRDIVKLTVAAAIGYLLTKGGA